MKVGELYELLKELDEINKDEFSSPYFRDKAKKISKEIKK